MTRVPSKWPTLTPLSPPASVLRLKRTSWYMSDHYICLQYIVLVSNFPCVLTLTNWSIENFFGISFAKNFPNNGFRFSFSPSKSWAMTKRVGASVPSLWTRKIMWWCNLESPVVELKYVFPRLKAQNDISPAALLAGITNIRKFLAQDNDFPAFWLVP